MNRIKVLMADDEPDVVYIMSKKLEQAGYDTITAGDGEEAWDKIKSEDPDIILLDLNMPKLDGFSLLKRLRDNPPTEKWQPVIIISARRELQDMKSGYDLDGDHYITKPCDIDDILKALKTMVNLIPQHQKKEDQIDL